MEEKQNAVDGRASVFRPRWKLGSGSAVAGSTGSLFHSLRARRLNSLGRVDRFPGVLSDGFVSILVL